MIDIAAQPLRNRNRSIRASSIDDDNFVRERTAGQDSLLDFFLLILCDDDDGQWFAVSQCSVHLFGSWDFLIPEKRVLTLV
ncbi:hypothetical protein D3C87_2127930 [compost metagenome]